MPRPAAARWLRVARRAARVPVDLPLFVLDALAVSGSYLAVLVLRFNGAVPEAYWRGFLRFLPVLVAVHTTANWLGRCYGQLWRHASVDEARRFLLSSGGAVAALAALVVVRQPFVPRSVVFIGAVFATMLMGAVRFQGRLRVFRGRRASDDVQVERVLIVGGGTAGAALIRDMRANPAAGLVPLAVLDDDPRKRGRSIADVPVLGDIRSLPKVAAALAPDQVVIAIPSADGSLVRRVMDASLAAGVPIRSLPGLREMVGGRVSVERIRELRIEDLVGRQPVRTDLDVVGELLRGRRVLITGGGGSIGGEIARQVAWFGAELVLLDHDESHLHDVAANLPEAPELVLADVRDEAVISELFRELRPEVVFHAAAHKHVPILERHPHEAVANNVRGTLNVVISAWATGVERLVFISSDKAVRPVNVMGASKRLGELIALSEPAPGSTCCAVRFGNVLGSRGSVVPTFVRQLERGGPITVTDDRMTRFFMSSEEAVQLVLQAAALTTGREVFLLEMGDPVRIIDLARRMILLSGRREGVDVAIKLTGMRPGERLHEELHLPAEVPEPTAHPSIIRITPAALPPLALAHGLEELFAASERRDSEEVTRLLYDLANCSYTHTAVAR